MTDCDKLIEQLQEQARNHEHLAAIANAEAVAEMHLELAVFSEEQTLVAEELCVDA